MINTVNTTLRCCTCGKTKQIQIPQSITFGFELLKYTQEAGWYPILDANWNRSLVFCSEACYKKQLTKAGYIRKNLIYHPTEEVDETK